MNSTSMRQRLSESFWFVPLVCLIAATALALGLIQIDQRIANGGGSVGFAGGPGAAREILSTIASSTLTLAALVFSITILALQLTSTQFSPRALRTFLSDRRTQLSLGIFVSTFFYALVALREVRGGEEIEETFVPGVTITGAFGLAVLSVGTFIYYIHHVSQSIRVITIIRRIGEDTTEAIDRQFPESPLPDVAGPPASPTRRIIRSDKCGVLADLDVDELVKEAARADVVVEVVPAIGDFVPCGAPLLRVVGDGEVDEKRLRMALLLQIERTMRSDPQYGLRQLVDIAEKALSPGFNDPSTAVQCLDQVHDLLRRLATRPFPSGRHADDDGTLRTVVPVPSWSDYVHLGLDEVRHWGAGSIQVHQRLRRVIDDLLTVAEGDRRAALFEQRQLLVARLADLEPTERRLADGP